MTSDDTTVAYPGREGAHSAAGADRLFPAARLVSFATFADVVDTVTRRECTYGVLPIESSLAGPVNETHDLLYDSSLSIVAETIMRVKHCLVGIAPIPLAEIREIRSHPVGLDQCRDLLTRAPQALATVATTTDAAAASLVELGDPTVVAIASARAAAIHKLVILADDIGDHLSYTRFAAVAPYTRLDRRHGDWRVALTFETLHKPGALHAAITPLAIRGIDMVQLVSRPIPSRPFDYRFDCVLGGHPLDPDLVAALGEMRSETARLRVIGSYRADHQEGWQTVAA
ncbi:MAG: prephenate dehydratase domain-containing protein [Gaiellales bacterium]